MAALIEPIRVISIIEAYTVTGPAKNLIRFAEVAAGDPSPGQPRVQFSFLTFYRTADANTAGRSNQFIDAARSAGIEVDVVGERFAFDPAVPSRMRVILEERQPHIVQTHAVKAHFLYWLFQRRKGRRWIAFHHGYTSEDLKQRAYNQLNRITLPAADHVVTVCSPFHELLVRQGVKPARITIIPNSIDPVVFADPTQVDALRQQYGLRSGERILLSVGRMSSEKGHADLIPAMVEIVRALPDAAIRHVLVGDGLEREKIQLAAAAAGVGARFVFAGHHRDVRPFYAMADVFVLPSHSEGSPNVLLEAMSAGLPVVATSVGGVPETLEHERSGLVVNPRNPSALATAVVRLLQNSATAEEFRAAAKADVASRFSPEAQKRAIAAVYKRLLASVQPSAELVA